MTVSQSHLIDLTSLSCYYMWMITTQIEKELTFLCGETVCYNPCITLQSKNPEYFVPLAMICLFTNSKKLQAVFTFPWTKGQMSITFSNLKTEKFHLVCWWQAQRIFPEINLKFWKLQCPFSFIYSNAMQISWFCTGRVVDKIYAK